MNKELPTTESGTRGSDFFGFQGVLRADFGLESIVGSFLFIGFDLGKPRFLLT